MLSRTQMKDGKLFFGEAEFSNLCRVLIRSFRYRNNNASPEAIVFPDIKEIEGVKIDYPSPKRGASKGSSSDQQ